MRAALSVFALVAFVAGCSSEAVALHGPVADSTSDATNGSAAPAAAPAPAAVAPAVAACSTVAAPTAVSNVVDASDLRFAGTGIYFTSSTTVNQVLKDGSNKAAIFQSANLVHSFVDTDTMLTLESDPTDATLPATMRAFPAVVAMDDDGNPLPAAQQSPFPTFGIDFTADDPGGNPTAGNFTAASANIFGSDASNVYIQATDTAGNFEIVQVAKADLTLTVLVSTTEGISSPQVTTDSIWYVQSSETVFRVTLPTADQAAGDPAQVFSETDTPCSLAVTDANAFCSIGTAIDSHDLSGATPTTLTTVVQSKVTSPYGPAVVGGAKLYVRDTAPDANVQHTIRVLTTGATPSESFAACGRATVTGIVVNGATLAWSEAGAGVFTTTIQ